MKSIGSTGLAYLWSKIKNLLATSLSAKADKATTLAGYGITDAINTSSTAQTKAGNLTAAKFIKNGGTSSQFLKADGSVDSSTYAPLASPALTGTPTAPTAANGTKTTQIATTAFVDNATTQSFNKIISMGENLVINGNGYMMDNTNFSSSVFNLLINNSSFGSFEYSGKKVVSSDYRIPLNPSLKYKLSADVKALNTGGSFYGYIDFYDIDGHRIEATNHMWHSDQCSYLTQDLNPGDTVVHINDLSKWNNTYAGHSLSKGITFWNYTNSKGYTYPPYTYTRNFFRNMYNEDTDVDAENGIIHLKSAWTGTVIPANTKISRTDSGNTFKYLWLKTPTTDSWLTCYGFCSGIDYSGGNAGGKFPPGAAFGRVGFLVNYGTEEKTWITNISLTTCAQIVDIPAAVTESTVSGWGFTKNTGTITGITMNGASKGTSGVVNLGTVITEHQDISGKADSSTVSALATRVTTLEGRTNIGYILVDS